MTFIIALGCEASGPRACGWAKSPKRCARIISADDWCRPSQPAAALKNSPYLWQLDHFLSVEAPATLAVEVLTNATRRGRGTTRSQIPHIAREVASSHGRPPRTSSQLTANSAKRAMPFSISSWSRISPSNRSTTLTIVLHGPTSKSKTSTRQFYASDLTRAALCFSRCNRAIGHYDTKASAPAAPPRTIPAQSAMTTAVLHNPERHASQASLAPNDATTGCVGAPIAGDPPLQRAESVEEPLDHRSVVFFRDGRPRGCRLA